MRIEISGIDAFEGTPVIDINPYIPCMDRAEEVSLPPWLSHWPLWISEGERNTADPHSMRSAEIHNLEYYTSKEGTRPSGKSESPVPTILRSILMKQDDRTSRRAKQKS